MSNSRVGGLFGGAALAGRALWVDGGEGVDPGGVVELDQPLGELLELRVRQVAVAAADIAAAVALVVVIVAAVAEFAAARGSEADTGGYYHTDDAKTAAVMRPSATLNAIID